MEVTRAGSSAPARAGRVPRAPAARARHARAATSRAPSSSSTSRSASSPRRSTRPSRWARRQRDLPAHLRARLLRDRDDVASSARASTSRASASRRSAPRRARPTCSSCRAASRSRWRRSSGASTTRCSSRKWAIAMGACSSSMGVFNNYAIVPADKFMPVDVHVPGCPPRPEALMHGILKLRDDDPGAARRGLARRATAARGTEEVVEPTTIAGVARDQRLRRRRTGTSA